MAKNDPIPRNYLSKKGGAWRPIRITELCTLMYSFLRASEHEDIGFEDTNMSYEMMHKRLNREFKLDPSTMESLLWSCNMLNERGEFKDVKGRSFDEFVTDVLKGDDIHRVYGWIVKKGEND